MSEASLQFHIEQCDYFGTLATVLDLVSQDLDRRGYHLHANTLSGLRDDLIYLQQSHCIQEITRSGWIRTAFVDARGLAPQGC
jgi:hypothetical protein